jgi:ankyrin repeat protein
MPPYSNTGDVLNAAASQSSIAMIDMLISHGAKIENRTALNHAVSSSNEDVERLPIMEHQLELGADINGMNLVGHGSKAGTPLHCKVKEGKLERARFLLHNGADPHKENRRGALPLEMANLSRRGDFIELFRGWLSP